MSLRKHVLYLSASDYRPTILRILSTNRCHPRDIVGRCDSSRTTVHRTLNGYLERGWVQKNDGYYTTTPFGDSILEQYDQLLTEIEAASEYGTWYSTINPTRRDLPPEIFDSASITTATEHAPQKPLKRITTVMSSIDSASVSVLTPVISSFFADALERSLTPRATVEAIVPQTGVDHHAATIEDRLHEFETTLYTIQTHPSYGIIIFEDEIFVLGYDDRTLETCLETSSTAVQKWAVNTFESIKSETTRCERFCIDR